MRFVPPACGLTAATRRARGRAPIAACARKPSAARRRSRRRIRRPVDARREPDQVAPRAHDLVLRDVSCSRRIARATGRSIERFAICSIPITSRSARVTRARSAAPDHAPHRSTRSRPIAPMSIAAMENLLAPPSRRASELVDCRDRAQSRAAASGTDPDRHHACARAKPDAPALRPRLAVPPWPARPRWVCELPDGMHTVGDRRRRLRVRQRAAAHRALVQPVHVRRPLGDQWRVARIHARRRLRAAGALALRRLGDGCEARAGARRSTGARSTAAMARASRSAALRPIDREAPVCHVSYFEADAFARWSGKHLPTELEWEVAARAGELHRCVRHVWEWTRSAYLPLSRLTAASRARSGEYNGKFMVNQMVLRGGSLATPAGHCPSRATAISFRPPRAGSSGSAPRRI